MSIASPVDRHAPGTVVALSPSARGRLAAVTIVAFIVGRLVTLAVLRWELGDWAQVGRRVVDWDGRWYLRIAAQGYPSTLPVGPDGSVDQNELAFLPAYPMLVRGVHLLTGAPLETVGVVVNVACGLAAAVLGVWLVARYVGSRIAAWGGVLWVVGPGSVVLGMAYSEGVYLLGLVVLLTALCSRRYLVAVVALAVAGLTRGALLPVVIVLIGHLVETWLATDRARRASAVLWPAALVVEAGLLVVTWPVAVWAMTGRRDALGLSQAAWDKEMAPHLVPDLRPWWVGPHTEAAGWSSPRGLLISAVMLAGAVGAVLAWRTAWPWVLRLLAPSFLVFLVLFTPPMMADARYLLPAFTIPVAYAAHARLLVTRAALVVVLLAAQVLWIVISWVDLLATP